MKTTVLILAAFGFVCTVLYFAFHLFFRFINNMLFTFPGYYSGGLERTIRIQCACTQYIAMRPTHWHRCFVWVPGVHFGSSRSNSVIWQITCWRCITGPTNITALHHRTGTTMSRIPMPQTNEFCFQFVYLCFFFHSRHPSLAVVFDSVASSAN